MLLERLNKLGVEIHLESNVLKAGRITKIKGSDNKIKTIEIETIVSAIGYEANRSLFEIISKRIKNIHLIGDCKKVNDIANAIHTGAFVAENL